jgi:putative acetyltransferase
MLTSLRRLLREEMDQAAVIHRKAFDERLPWLAGLHTHAEDRAFFRDRVFVECEVWGAFDGELVGFVAFREGWIDQLYVAPDRQRRGVGAALLQIAKAASSSLSFWTFQRNHAARRFYGKHGFAAVEETDGGRNEEREPDVRYHWSAPCGPQFPSRGGRGPRPSVSRSRP